ncbi:hypothetical protein HYR69_12250, partial [Candidatus Sumerlaeota bacterium]|nr:hypothetical protein [Candidatus Sumerlaeota bacterium]
EKGAWRLLSEGKDNDGDEVWNEDGLGGVNFNRNFPYNYEYFGAAAGLHPVSEIETRALADFVVAHPNIGIVFTFGAADNLLKTPDAAKDEGAKSDEKRTTMGRRMNTNKPATGIDEDDIGYYRELGETYRKALGLDKELKNAAQGGSFSDWMYFHRGRFSLAAQAWSAAEQIEIEKCAQKKEKEAGEKKDDKDKPEVDAAKADEKKPDEKTDEKKPSGEKREGDKDDKRNEDERAALKWFDDHAPSAFLPWKPFDHPDFKGRRAEIGGYAPYALSNPPEDLLGGVATKEADFLTTLALRLPRVGIRKIETKHLGKSVYEVKIQVENTGYLPTVLAHGETTGEVLPTRLTLELEDAAFLSGSRITRLGPLKGSGGMQETLLTLRVPKRKRIALNVISALGGQASANLEIGGER